MKFKELALAMIQQKADTFYVMGTTAITGAFEACEEQGGYAFGHDGYYDDQKPGTVICSFVRNLSAPVKTIIEEYQHCLLYTSRCV